MREFLTLLAFLLVALLAAALAGPYFIDWSAHREMFEARLGEALGRPVLLRGPIDLKLLPTPRLELGAFALQDAPGQPGFSGEGLRVELSAMPLLGGEFHVTDVAFERPEIRLTLRGDGAVQLPDLALPAGKTMRFDNVSLSHATFILQDPAGREVLRVADLDLTGEAGSLEGPFKASGQVATPRGPIAFNLSTGALERGKLRLKAVVTQTAFWPRSEIEGAIALAVSPNVASRAVFDGTASFAGRLTSFEHPDPKSGVPWRLSGAFHADSDKAVAHSLEIRLGEDDRALAAAGAGDIAFGPRPAAHMHFGARQIDLDRLPPLQELVSNWLSDPALSAQLPFALEADLTAPLVNLGGQSLTEANVGIGLDEGKPVDLRLSVNGPGRSALLLNGAVETGAAAGFKGKAQLSSQDPPRLADWLAGFAPIVSQRLALLPLHALEAAGDAQISRIGFSVNNLALKVDRSQLAGALAFTSAVWTEKARLFADLTAQALDLDAVPDISGAFALAGDADLAITLDARAIKVARFGDGLIDAGRVGFKLLKTGALAKLENFSLNNLGGANLTASGQFDGAHGQLSAHVDAAQLADAAELLRKIAPGQASTFFARRAGALSPANLELSADLSGGLALTGFSAQGSVGGAKLSVQWRPDENDRAFAAGALTLDSPDGATLLRQIGFDPPSGGGNTGRGRLSVNVRGRPGEPMETRGEAALTGGLLSFSGVSQIGVDGLVASGALKGAFDNMAAPAGMFGVTLPGNADRLPAQLAARLNIRADRIDLAQLSGRLGAANLDGALSLLLPVAAGRHPRLGGALKIDRLALSTLTGLALGPFGAVAAGAVWSEQKWGQPLLGAPPADIRLDIANFELWPGVAPQPASLQLELGPGLVAIRDIAVELAGGATGGDIVVRRDGADASLQGKLEFSGLASQLPTVSGAAAGEIEVTATGQSALALASSMAGAGRALMSAMTLPHSDPAAIGRLLAIVDQGGFTVEEGEVRRGLERELDRGPMLLGDQNLDIAVAAGVARITTRETEGRYRAALDLRNLALDQRLTLRESQRPKEWSAETPQIDVILKGPLFAPEREIEAAVFTNALAAREIARETARIEAVESDIRERAAFNRRLKGLRKLRQDEIDYQNYLAEQARREEEARRIAAEEERRRAAAALAQQTAAEAQRQEALRRAAEEEARRLAEEARQAEAARLAAAEQARKEDEARRLAAEEDRRRSGAAQAQHTAEEALRQDALRRAAEEEAKRRAEEARRAVEEEARRQAAIVEAQRKATEEQRLDALRRGAEEETKRQADEASRRAEEARRVAEDEARRLADEARRIEVERKAQDAARLDEFRRAAAEEARNKVEEARRAAEKRKAAEQDAKTRADSAKTFKPPEEDNPILRQLLLDPKVTGAKSGANSTLAPFVLTPPKPPAPQNP